MAPETRGFTLELFFIDGRPDGMLTAEEINWTGHVLLTPRTRIFDALKRPQASYTGVYLLLGEDGDGSPMLYVGEGENMAQRIRNHDTNKDWWTKAVLITTGANALHKAHVRYLEAHLIKIAGSVGRIKLDNNAQPTPASLSEAGRNSMDKFLHTLLMVLPATGVDCFLEQSRPKRTHPVTDDLDMPVFEFAVPKHKIKAKAVLENGEFVVQEGSTARDNWHGSEEHNTGNVAHHAQLCETGVLQLDGDKSVFTRDYVFSSPSAAAAIVAGRPANGPASWKLAGSNKTYREWEAEQLGSADLDER